MAAAAHFFFPNMVVTSPVEIGTDTSRRAAGKSAAWERGQARGMWSIGWANRGSPEPEGSTVAPETGEMAKATGTASAMAVT